VECFRLDHFLIIGDLANLTAGQVSDEDFTEQVALVSEEGQ
jgi:hypothetical protein